MHAEEGPRGAARARWLAELAAALAEADRVVTMLLRWRGGSREAESLSNRIGAARSQVEALQRGGSGPDFPIEADPLWTLGEARRPRVDDVP
ncbi:MAG: hypothetical protein ABIO85_09345 [Sphingomicrobium sp.]